MSEAETKRKFDEIVDFADIGKFLDTPVSHYSSGMYARLGFSVAMHVDADIFLADEVLAVGDRPFKKKCMAKMQEIRREGTTIFYVSHATASVRAMCDRVLVLESGHLNYDSKTREDGSRRRRDPLPPVRRRRRRGRGTDEELRRRARRGHLILRRQNYIADIAKKYRLVIH